MPPSTFPVGLFLNKSVIYGGQDYWLLKYLSKSLNFEFTMKEPASEGNCYSPYDWSYVGYCKMLLKKEVQLAGFPDVIEEWSYHHFEPTAVYYMTSSVLISANPHTEESVSLTFDSTTLSSIFALYVTIVFVMFLNDCFSANQNRRGLVNLFLDAFSILCLEAVKFRNVNAGRWILIAVWMVSGFFIISVALGEITSTAAVKKPLTNYINTLEDMNIHHMEINNLTCSFLSQLLEVPSSFFTVLRIPA